MKVSIIIPVYNVEPYIKRCLTSVLNQSYGDIEILLIDDCSPDKSMDIARRLLENHPRKNAVEIITHTQNQGLSCSRNTGINAASGDYLYFLDSDDYITDNAIELLAAQAMKYDADFAIGNYTLIGNNRRPPRLELPSGAVKGNKEIMKTFYREQWYVMAWNKLIKTDFVKRHNLYFEPGIVHEDAPWSFKIATVAQTMAVVNATTLVYDLREGSITAKSSKWKLQCRIKVLEILYNYLLEHPELQNHLSISMFEKLKWLYFRFVYYLSDKDRELHMQAYKTIRSCRISTTRLMPTERFLALNYIMPEKIGIKFYELVIRFKFKLLKLGLTKHN